MILDTLERHALYNDSMKKSRRGAGREYVSGWSSLF